MEALLTSISTVALSEIGDKTQLLTLFLAARFRSRWAIFYGILLATLLNHGVSAWFGNTLAHWLQSDWLTWILGASFILVGLWLLIPDNDDQPDSPFLQYNAFLATLILFFLAEIGDKTQVATVLLAARFQDIAIVTLGSTLGMLLANVPILMASHWFSNYLNPSWTRRAACVLFILLGLTTLLLPFIET